MHPRKVKKHSKSEEINSVVSTEMGIRCRRECPQCWTGHSCSLCRGLSWHNIYLLPGQRVTGGTPTLHPREVDVSWGICRPWRAPVRAGLSWRTAAHSRIRAGAGNGTRREQQLPWSDHSPSEPMPWRHLRTWQWRTWLSLGKGGGGEILLCLPLFLTI